MEAYSWVIQLFEQIEKWSTGISSVNLAEEAVTTTKIADGAVTQAKVADGVAKIASDTYVGDGTTANRVVTLAFTPRNVLVFRTDGTPITFDSIAKSGLSDVRSWYRAANGTLGNSTTHWQGIVSSGFKLGTSATGDSNAAGVTYSYVAIG